MDGNGKYSIISGLIFSLFLLHEVQGSIPFPQQQSSIIIKGKGTLTVQGEQPRDVDGERFKHCKAVVQTVVDGKKYLGANGMLSVNKPELSKADQWSAARVKLMNGPDSIEAGWMVNPQIFNDNEAHLYARFTAGQSGCINTQCPGFVHVGEKVPLGRIPEQYSVIDGQQYLWNISIDKHQDDGNWWLSIGPKKYGIGYWPKNLFTSLADAASQVEWGGEVSNPGPTDPPPGMGNGFTATYDTNKSAFVGHLTVIDESFHAINPSNTVKFQDCDSLYKVLDFGYKGEYSGHLIVYGGWNQPGS